MFSFLKSMFTSNDVNPDELQSQLQENPGVVIDVRTLGEFNDGHLVITDKHLDILNGDFQRAIGDLDKSKTYYLYCRSGNRSGQAAQMMRQSGFENVYNVGGFADLAAAGFETKTSN
ncbi:MAG: rhodanese-like domain-containing protein [Bacteroidetes bacterium]|nr:rhodanese-like domain-containing protein [Bacteroidota bacterium]